MTRFEQWAVENVTFCSKAGKELYIPLNKILAVEVISKGETLIYVDGIAKPFAVRSAVTSVFEQIEKQHGEE